MRKLKNVIAKVNTSLLVTVVFMLFLIIVGSVGIPQLLENTGRALSEQKSLSEYIENVDAQYNDMLSTSLEYDFIQNKSFYIDFNGFVANILRQPSVNYCVKLQNGHLTSTYKTKEMSVDPIVESITELYDMQRAQDGDFLVVIAPFQISKYNPQLPVGYYDFSNNNADDLINRLQEWEVPVLDLRQSMYEQEIDHNEAFFVTDHHWKPQIGFWAYTEILNELSQRGVISEINTFFTDVNNYEFKVFEDSFLGSCGQRTGRYFAGIDDFELIFPCYDTNINIKIPEEGIDISGAFENVAYRYDKDTMQAMLENPDYYNISAYGLYGHGDKGIMYTNNVMAVEDKRVLLIGDSFGNVPFSLLSLYLSDCMELDMRYYSEDFATNFEDFNPDVIVILVNAANIFGDNTTYDFYDDSLSNTWS